MTLQELEQIKNRVIERRSMNLDRKSPRVTVGMGTCGIKAGASEVLEELKSVLSNNEETVVTHVGCIGLCSYEPVLEVAMPGDSVVIYGRMTPDKVREVVREHILGGNPVNRWVVASRTN